MVFWCESCQPIHFGHQGEHVLKVQDMMSPWNGGPKSSSRFGSIPYLSWPCFFTTHFCLTVWSYTQIAVSLAKSVWKACWVLSMGTLPHVTTLFWCKILADLDSAFCPALKHQGLGLLYAFLLLNICLILKITCSHVCLFNRLAPSQFTHLSMKTCVVNSHCVVDWTSAWQLWRCLSCFNISFWISNHHLYDSVTHLFLSFFYRRKSGHSVQASSICWLKLHSE